VTRRVEPRPTVSERLSRGGLDQARNNSIENFKLVFDPKFINMIVMRMDANQSIFKQVLDDQEFQDILKGLYVRKMYSRLRRPDTEASPPVG
jgi:hypothetical protein